MKNLLKFKNMGICSSISIILLMVSFACTKDLLNQIPTGELASTQFWKTEADATYALNGLYSHVRALFTRDYFFDGHGDYVRARSNNFGTVDGDLRQGDAYRADTYNPTGYAGNHDKMMRYLYGGIHRANYVIENVEKMLPDATATSLPGLEAIIGEARLLRALCYFKLIAMWGDVPLIDKVMSDKSEAESLTRTPIATIKDFIVEDCTYAFDKLPDAPPSVGRQGKPAALALRGKIRLYWACWNNFGWPELDTFTPNATEAQTAYAAAAQDFKAVIENFGLTLFRNGDPGPCDPPGKADNLPNYYYLFTPLANGDGEIILGFAHGGLSTGQGEELMRDFAGRNHEGSQCWVAPRYEIADRYQAITTGDFCAPLVMVNPDAAGVGAAVAFNTPGGALNPQSYVDRDYRMKSTIQWNYETSIGFTSRVSTGWYPFVYKTWNANITAANLSSFPGFTTDHIGQITYNTDGVNSGYVFRKFVRNTAGLGRSEGNYHWPVIRLADVYLMYAEAINEANGAPDALAVSVVNKVRHRGNLPALAAAKTANKNVFFDAVEQERIVELIGEGQRSFDLRRWRAFPRAWCGPQDPNGVWTKDTYGANVTRYFQNLTDKAYSQLYIWRIPESERNKNPNLTQNAPWL
jgi:hypothetical protein